MVPKQHTERTSRLSTPTGERPLRADARRNRERIVAAARSVFAESGYDVPVDAVAARAGVGAGTLYRHFPDKETLFSAVQEERVGELADHAERLAGEDPRTALFSFLELLSGEAEVKRDLPDAISVSAQASGRMRGALADLLARAQEAGAARPEVTGDDLVALLKGLFAATRETGPAQTDRIRAVMVDGLRNRT